MQEKPMPRRTSARLLVALTLALPTVLPLAGCGAARTMPAGAPVMRTTTAPAVRSVAHPAVTSSTASSAVSNAAFLTQLGASSPAFSPRGDRLAFSTPSRGVLISSPDGQNALPLPGSLPGDRDPAWSPA